ncbi:MAG: hypothetical protein WAR22_09375 [Desulfomonilia bacterium]
MENRIWKRLVLLGIVLALSFTGAACDDDDDDDSPAPQVFEEGNNVPVTSERMLDRYDFTMAIQSGEPFLTLVQSVDDTERTLVVSNRGESSLSGTYETSAGEDGTQRLVTINGGSAFLLTATNYWNEGTLDDFSIFVEEDIVFQEDSPGPQDNLPVQGEFTLRYGVNVVRVVFLEDDSGVPGAHMSLDGGGEDFLPVDEFDDLPFDNVLVWQQKAALGFLVLEFLAEQVMLSARTALIIEASETVLEQNGAITFACDTFPADAVLDPDAAEPSLTLTWIDSVEDGQIGTGDAFKLDFVSCWANDEGMLIDDLIDGQVDLLGYVRVVEPRDGGEVLTQFGFDPGDEATAGVVFIDLTHTEIEEDDDGVPVADPEETYTINGGYSILFTEPAAIQEEQLVEETQAIKQ